MPVYEKKTMPTLLQEIKKGEVVPAYLFIGERYLCQQAAEQIATLLCTAGGTVHSIDGDTEDKNRTLSKLRSFSLLRGRQVFRVNNTRLFHSKDVAQGIWKRAVQAHEANKPEKALKYLRAMMEAGGLEANTAENDPASLTAVQWKKCFGFAKPAGKLEWTGEILTRFPDQEEGGPGGPGGPGSTNPPNNAGEMLLAALDAGIPANNILMLLAEEVDKRKKLYKSFKDKYVVINLHVDTGASAQAKKVQRAVLQEQVGTVLKKMHKKMAAGVMEQLLERVGFHPVAVVMETEKLALSVGKAGQITLQDLDRMVGRTRQEAVFELTQAISEKKVGQALLIATRLQENGIHALALLATLRNFTRTLLLFRILLEQEQYHFRPGISANAFQFECLPALKKNERWKKELSGHPFAVYMRFKTASGFSLSLLRAWLGDILSADMRLKGTSVDTETVVQHLILSMITAVEKGSLQNHP
ncbi:MAG: DNA polymerase III subunit delta [Candidatus Electrothrix sp. MAN1_4]|nr:DNA polymerase III subunit delta [Candidatus Electrothrix sp. MAN1_4]